MRRARTPGSPPSPKRCTCELTVAERHRERDRHAAEFICRRAVRTSHASAGSSRVGPRHGQGRRGARVGPAMRAAGGMRVNRGRPGAWPSSVSSRFRSTAPLTRVCFAGGAQPRPPSTLPACAGTQGAVGACVFATCICLMVCVPVYRGFVGRVIGEKLTM